MIEILCEVLLSLSIVAVIFLIVAFYKTITILSDVKDSSSIINKRVKDVDSVVSGLENTVRGFSGILKSFLISLDGIKSYFKNKEKKESKDE